MAEISINVLKKHHNWQHADIEILIDGVVKKTLRVSKDEVESLLDNEEIKQTVVAIILRNIIKSPSDSLATVQQRAAKMSVSV